MSDQEEVWMSESDLKLEERKETEVVPRAQRLRFSAKYKLRIVAEADRCKKLGELGAPLRQEETHSSSLGRRRKARAEGKLNPSSPTKRGPAASPDKVVLRENAKVRKNITRLERRLKHAELIIGVQRKLSARLGISLEETDDSQKSGTQSRPHVSNDNPYSEARFKTMKYRADYPKRFGSLEDARGWAKVTQNASPMDYHAKPRWPRPCG